VDIKHLLANLEKPRDERRYRIGATGCGAGKAVGAPGASVVSVAEGPFYEANPVSFRHHLNLFVKLCNSVEKGIEILSVPQSTKRFVDGSGEW